MPKSLAIWASVTSGSRFSATRTTSSRNSLGNGVGIVIILPDQRSASQIECHLFMQQALEHRRGHGGLYDALNAGRIDTDQLATMIAQGPVPKVTTPDGKARHLTQDDMPMFTQLRMTAFGHTAIELANDPAFDEWTFSQKILYALDKELTARQERRTQKSLKASRSPNPEACIEELRYLPDRTLNREAIGRLASCQ